MDNFADLVSTFLEIINLTIPLVFGLTLAVVIWKVTKAWIISNDPGTIEDGKNTIVVAVIALTVMASIWGLVRVLQASLF